MADTRIEKDSLGEVEVPAAAYFGAQTERARRNFPVSGLRFPRRFLAALGAIKGEAAAVNAKLGLVPADVAEAISRCSTGSSTSTSRSTSSRLARRPRPT
jgi:fumarate hydratase class II